MRLLPPEIVIAGIGAISGVAMQLDWMANQSPVMDFAVIEVIFRLVLSAIITPLVLWPKSSRSHTRLAWHYAFYS